MFNLKASTTLVLFWIKYFKVFHWWICWFVMMLEQILSQSRAKGNNDRLSQCKTLMMRFWAFFALLFIRFVGVFGKGNATGLYLSEMYATDSKNFGIKSWRGNYLFSKNYPLYQWLKPSQFPLLLIISGVEFENPQFYFHLSLYSFKNIQRSVEQKFFKVW